MAEYDVEAMGREQLELEVERLRRIVDDRLRSDPPRFEADVTMAGKPIVVVHWGGMLEQLDPVDLQQRALNALSVAQDARTMAAAMHFFVHDMHIAPREAADMCHQIRELRNLMRDMGSSNVPADDD